jgi:hypothetical protein
MPVHSKLEEQLDAYITATAEDKKGPLFRTSYRRIECRSRTLD